MSAWASFIAQIVSLIALLIGALFGYWNFGSALVVFLAEFALLVLIGAGLMMSSKANANPGLLLFGGGFLVLMGYALGFLIASDIGEVSQMNLSYAEPAFVKFIPYNLETAWPIVIVSGISVVFSLRGMKMNDKLNSLQQTFLKKIVILFGIIVFSFGMMYLFHSQSKILALSAVVISRILAELFIHRTLFGVSKTSTGKKSD